MSDNTNIKSTRVVYPQIYAYTMPDLSDKEGWVKIGYTERLNVEDRIKEQTHTAAVRHKYNKLWAEPARYSNADIWFKDHEFHNFLTRFKKIEREPLSEWFYYNGYIDRALEDFKDFRDNIRDQALKEIQYKLRKEQTEAVEVTLNYAKNHKNGEFLWNAKPRFGKTLATYDLMRKLDAIHVLVVTNRPAIANSWYDDFERFIAWQTNYKFVSTSDSLKDRTAITREEYTRKVDFDSRMIAFISLQDLKGSVSFGGHYNKLGYVKDIEWDLLVIDEAHEGVDTLKTDVAFERINRKFTLHLSGTPFKPVATGKFNSDQIFNWSYADEQKAKEEWDDTEKNNPYEELPQMNLFSYQMSQMITEEVNKGADIDGENIDFAFDLNEFFETRNGKFIHEAEVRRWLDTLTSNEKYPFSTKDLRDELKHTFWFLDRVDSAKALEQILKSHPVFENYGIVIAAGDGKSLDEDDQVVNQKSLNRVRKAIKENNRTITLSVGQLTTGITVPEWTGVLMLSNLQSPSLYMQAAFRSQNPWIFEEDGKMKRKENSYVFDFSPERTLVIYDEFANNLSLRTLDGGGTTEERKENIRELLNFFPVIAEDKDGKMIEIDYNQVLTIPKTIKAQEVVKRGFMSNLLFQGISKVFGSPQALEILEKLNPVDIGQVTQRKSNSSIDTMDVQVDKNNQVVVEEKIVINETNARFGGKVFSNAVDDIITANQNKTNISKVIANHFRNENRDIVKDLAKDHGVTVAQAERILENSAKVIAREVYILEAHKNIEIEEAKAELKQKVALADENEVEIQSAEQEYNQKTKIIEKNFESEIIKTVEEKSKEEIPNITKSVLVQEAENKKNTVEDDIRARLRGFARTIPSFLMAYGDSKTNIYNFDKNISNDVFEEVTGITLDDFRQLRDVHEFFDPIVFDESVKEFLSKRKLLSNYFDDSHDEDIFDYIPPQRTNQIYTPKRVVKMMVDELEKENPEIFKDKNKTFADLYMKSGLYITEIVKRLYNGLKDEIPNDDERINHILENQVYGFAPSEIIYRIAKKYIFGFDDITKNINDSHIVHLDTTPFAKGESDVTLEEKCDELFSEKRRSIDEI